jgi:hypothetical protein
MMRKKDFIGGWLIGTIGCLYFPAWAVAEEVSPLLPADSTRQEIRAAKRAAWYEKRKEEREEREALEAQQDSVAFAQAVAAITQGSWVLQANQVTFRNGMVRLVSSGTNFISVNQDIGTIQTAFNNYNLAPSPNGLGGVTIQGAISPITQKQNDDGCLFTAFSVMDGGRSCIVHLWLTIDSNQANATIYPNFTGNILQMSGTLVPYNQASIFVGNAW